MNISNKTPSASDKAAKLQVGLGGVTSLQAWKAMQSGQVTPQPGVFKLELLHLFRWTSLVSMMGRIENLKLQGCGQQRCTLSTSIGDLQLQANRESLPMEFGNGSWVEVKLRLRRGLTDPAQSNTSLIRAAAVKLSKGDPTTAWVPIVPNDRWQHMRRLRLLLTKMEPSLQALFMTVMVHDTVQKGFFSHIAAMDHHCYPGGLFDCSVKAAELAYRQQQFSQRERGIAALACLLFDLGKVSDDLYRSDRTRCDTGLEPHPSTGRLLRRELDTMAHFDPALVASLRSLLTPADWTEWLAPPGITPTLKQCVHQAVRDAWAFDRPAKDFCTDMGEKNE
jgi:hypothetical protein